MEVVQSSEEHFRLHCRHVLVYEASSLGYAISENVVEFDDVRASEQCLQDLNFSINFLNLDRFENLDYAFLIVDNVTSLVNFRVLATSKLMVTLIGIHVSPGDVELTIVAVLWRSGETHATVVSGPDSIGLARDHLLLGIVEVAL